MNVIEVGALGVCVAGGISVTTAPFDLANTMKQGKNISIYKTDFLKSLSKKILGKTLLKTGGLNFTILCIHCIGSAILMEKLTKK